MTRPIRRLRVWSVVAVGALAAALALVLMPGSPARGPDAPYAPYDHDDVGATSVATEQVVNGEASVVADGLEARGYWCVQPRSNAAGAQVRCQSPAGDASVDLMTDRDGDVLYADIDLGRKTPAAQDRLWSMLSASFLQLWPQDRPVIADLLDDARPDDGLMPFGDAAAPLDPSDQFRTHEARTDDATWTLESFYGGAPLALRVRTAGLQDRSWPFDARHYATSLASAASGLEVEGFSCSLSCSSPTGQQSVAFETHEGQIITATVFLRTETDRRSARDPSGKWVRERLVFLAPAVREPIARRIEQSRLRQESWRGVVAGTPVDITVETGGSTTPDDQPAYDLTATIGIALLRVE